MPIDSTESNADHNTYVFDAESTTELSRLMTQDRITTQAMGGSFSGLTNEEVEGLHNVLDVACGPGGWVLDAAFAYPDIQVAGIDISTIMVHYANTRASSQGLSNASFGVMDITQPLDFASGAFDLVNVRFVGGVLLRDAWAPFVAECTRLLHPGGILRLTEAIDWGVSTTPAFEQMGALLNQALWRTKHGFSPDGRTVGLTPMLPTLLRAAGYQNIQIKAHVLDQSAGAPAWMDSYRNYEAAYAQLQPLFVKTGLITKEDVEQLYQQLLAEIHSDDFRAMWNFMTAWGTKA